MLRLCIFTDASDRFSASVVKQCELDELNKDVPLQIHQTLSFLSGEFTEAELGWTTFEKERFAMTQTFTGLDYMIQCRHWSESSRIIATYHLSFVHPFSTHHLVVTM